MISELRYAKTNENTLKKNKFKKSQMCDNIFQLSNKTNGNHTFHSIGIRNHTLGQILRQGTRGCLHFLQPSLQQKYPHSSFEFSPGAGGNSPTFSSFYYQILLGIGAISSLHKIFNPRHHKKKSTQKCFQKRGLHIHRSLITMSVGYVDKLTR